MIYRRYTNYSAMKEEQLQALYEKTLEEKGVDETLDLLREMKTQRPKDKMVLQVLIYHCLTTKRIQEAEQLFEEVPHENLYKRYLWQTQLCDEGAREYEQALKHINSAIGVAESQKDQLGALWVKCKLLHKLGREDELIATLRQAIEVAPFEASTVAVFMRMVLKKDPQAVQDAFHKFIQGPLDAKTDFKNALSITKAAFMSGLQFEATSFLLKLLNLPIEDKLMLGEMKTEAAKFLWIQNHRKEALAFMQELGVTQQIELHQYYILCCMLMELGNTEQATKSFTDLFWNVVNFAKETEEVDEWLYQTSNKLFELKAKGATVDAKVIEEATRAIERLSSKEFPNLPWHAVTL